MKHFAIYFENGNQVTTALREWARQNQTFFPNYDFINSDWQHTPTTDIVAKYLCNTMGFKEVNFQNERLHIKL